VLLKGNSADASGDTALFLSSSTGSVWGVTLILSLSQKRDELQNIKYKETEKTSFSLYIEVFYINFKYIFTQYLYKEVLMSQNLLRKNKTSLTV
jgi:hypothetical protein